MTITSNLTIVLPQYGREHRAQDHEEKSQSSPLHPAERQNDIHHLYVDQQYEGSPARIRLPSADSPVN